jgi:hypothetical protein
VSFKLQKPWIAFISPDTFSSIREMVFISFWAALLHGSSLHRCEMPPTSGNIRIANPDRLLGELGKSINDKISM